MLWQLALKNPNCVIERCRCKKQLWHNIGTHPKAYFERLNDGFQKKEKIKNYIKIVLEKNEIKNFNCFHSALARDL